MTAKTAPRPAPKKPASASATPAGQQEAERQVTYLDPAAIVRDEYNARETDTAPDADLITSVKELGVEEPISVRPRPDGTYGAFKGWRRAQAQQIANDTAEQDGRDKRKIPVFVREDLVGRDGWTRMLSLVENDHREQMTERDKITALEMSLVDMSEGEQKDAARALGLKRGAVTSARKAARLSDAELRKATAGGMDLEQMADLSEVQDVRGAERMLAEAMAADTAGGKGGRGHWDHAMSRLRQTLADTQAREKAVKELAEAGIPLLRDRYSWGEKDESKPLEQLTTGLGNPLTQEKHAQCPGHSARLDEEHKPVWYCSDPARHGHKLRPEAKKPKNPLSETQAAERSKVIACNKAWKAAREVRKDFIAKLCQGKTLPDQARKLTLLTLLNTPYHYSSWAAKHQTEDVARFLGIKDPNADVVEAVNRSGGPFDELVERTSKAKEWHAVFASVAASFEYDLREPKAWALLSDAQAGWLLFLESQGYTLAEVEEQALAAHRPKPDEEQTTDGQETTGEASKKTPGEAA
ncbi:ParB/RepB/Spo0J family partition protein [Streptomyces sp. 8N706]|uniref:ParB/RepB/Spo0J family partition protein n=1 Tax=Streptomyces sp. 8N706 TaxID=3457416 RepID=UPI003FD263AF